MKGKKNKSDFNDLSLVVLSSESYSYLWSNFIRSWNKYCKNLVLDKFIVTTNKNTNIRNFKIISSSLDKNDFWSKRIKYALKKINTKNVLIFTDDCFLDDKLDVSNFKKIFIDFKKKKILHLRLCPIPNENIYDKKNFYKLDYFSFHRISLQPSLWNKKFLEQMLSYNETPRMFEENGSIRTKNLNKIFSTNYFVFNFKEIIRIGKLTPEGKKLIIKNNLILNKHYKNMLFLELFDHYYKKLKSIIFYLLPKNFRKRYIKNKYSK